MQGLYAIGSGGLFGVGLGESMQKLGFVPEAQNDMIFSIICEELGLTGAVAVLVIFGLLIWRLMVIATWTKDLVWSSPGGRSYGAYYDPGDSECSSGDQSRSRIRESLFRLSAMVAHLSFFCCWRWGLL